MAKNGEKKALTAAQHRAVAALLEARDVVSAARMTGIPARSIYRWMEFQSFQQALERGMERGMEETLRRLTHASSLATDVLERGMCQEEPMALQLKAAEIVLAKVLKLRDGVEMAKRLEALEELCKD